VVGRKQKQGKSSGKVPGLNLQEDEKWGHAKEKEG